MMNFTSDPKSDPCTISADALSILDIACVVSSLAMGTGTPVRPGASCGESRVTLRLRERQHRRFVAFFHLAFKVAALTVYMLAEKVLPGAERWSRWVGVISVAAGLYLWALAAQG